MATKLFFTADQVEELLGNVTDNAVMFSKQIQLSRLAAEGLRSQGLAAAVLCEHLEGIHELIIKQDEQLRDVYELFVLKVQEAQPKH